MTRIPIILATATLLIIACICSSTSSTPPQKIGEATNAPTVPSLQIYKIGDVVQVGTLTITLNSAEFQGNLLVANFTIENKGTEETTISTLAQFSAKDGNGTSLDEEIFNCGSSIGGTIISGDKTKGNVCYKNVTTNNARIYFDPSMFTSETVVWEVNK